MNPPRSSAHQPTQTDVPPGALTSDLDGTSAQRIHQHYLAVAPGTYTPCGWGHTAEEARADAKRERAVEGRPQDDLLIYRLVDGRP